MKLRFRGLNDCPETTLWSQVLDPGLSAPSGASPHPAGRRVGWAWRGRSLKDHRSGFSHFFFVGKGNTTFPPFSERSCHGLSRSTRAQECCPSDHKARASRSGNSSYSVPKGPNPSAQRAWSGFAALGTADSQLHASSPKQPYQLCPFTIPMSTAEKVKQRIMSFAQDHQG